jgi:hypothetical protein
MDTKLLHEIGLNEDQVATSHEKQIHAHQERIAEGGFSIQGVHANPSFAYSIGLTHTLGFEIIAKGKISVGILGSLINITAKYLLEGGTLEGPFSTDDFKVDDAELRLKLVDCEDVSYILNQYANATCNPDYLEVPLSAFKQLFVGDERNRLPGERGYNRTMGQQLKDLKDGPSDQDTLH